jgi:hypothetical protein
MPGHSRPEGRRASHAYVPGIHVFTARPRRKGVDGRDKPGHDESVLVRVPHRDDHFFFF